MILTFLGDIFPSEEAFTLGFGIKSKFEKRNGTDWRNAIMSITKGADVVVGNLESPLIDSHLVTKPVFYGNPKFARFMKDCNINVLNIANNHILEHGNVGYEQTLKTLAESKIDIVGDNNRVLFLDHEGCKIAIAGFNGVDLNAFKNDGCFSELNKRNIEAAINDMVVNGADLKIFCFHWGNEYIHKPSMEQIDMAYKLIDAGADVIIGHHPHVIQPHEMYNGGHIFYSLGNFCFDNPFQSRQFSKGMGVTITFDTVAKMIQDISVFGVKLKQKELISVELPSDFNHYFQKIQKKYFSAKGNSRYNIMYHKELKRRHFAERILMKLSLFKLYLNINPAERRLLIKNIKRFYCK